MEVFGQEPFTWDSGPELVRSVGVVSGAAASSFGEAIAMGLDAFLTGEPAEHVMADALESGTHFIAAGHYATETFGVRRLGELVAEQVRRRAPLHRRAESDLALRARGPYSYAMALRLARWTCALAALAAAVPAAASADPAAGITGIADLALFDTANPSGLTSRPITGLQTATETVVGLDTRPATGQLFLITVPTGVVANALIRSYTLDPATATATFVGEHPGARSRAPPTRRPAPTSTRSSTACGWSTRATRTSGSTRTTVRSRATT